jgi:hypothetical protein
MKFFLNITFSKIMAFLILILGTAYSFVTKESSVITFAITVSAGLIGWKQQKDKEEKRYENHN